MIGDMNDMRRRSPLPLALLSRERDIAWLTRTPTVPGSVGTTGVAPKGYLLQATRAALTDSGTVTLPHALLPA